MKIVDIARIIEAVLFVSGDGVDRDEFKRIYDLSDKELNKCLDIIKEKYSGDSGVHLITFKNKLQLCSNPELADSVAEILNPIRERSLTKAALETVAIVAYKQPITRTEIEQIRGVNSDYAVQLLQNNNLIEVVGRKDAVGKPLLFGTTDNFLKRFELDSLEQLPNYKELLDRIRVIHSEGDSLYREFSIPEEDAQKQEDIDAQTAENVETQSANEVIEDVKISSDTQDTEMITESPNQTKPEVVEDIITEQTVEQSAELEVEQDIEEKTKAKKPKKRKSLIEALEDKDENEKTEQINADNNTTETTNSNNNDIIVEAPKLSWRDKMRAKMDENAGHYENLDNMLERK